MSRFEKLGRKYKYRMRQKYQEDPFAFIVLWSLFFSAVFLIFAFRGLIAATFMPKIDVSDEIADNEITNEVNQENNSTTDNQTVNSDSDITNEKTTPPANETPTAEGGAAANTSE